MSENTESENCNNEMDSPTIDPKIEELLKSQEFKKALLELADCYDYEKGQYPESQYEGRAVYHFYLRTYHPETAEAEIEQYYTQYEIEKEEYADLWFSSYTEEKREELAREGRVTEEFLEKYNKKHGTNYKPKRG